MSKGSIIGRPMAMARPGRPSREAQLVSEAARALLIQGELNCSRKIARRVAAAVVAAALQDLDRVDDFATALAAAARHLAPSPIDELASDPEIDTAAEIMRRRVQRYQARCCRQISEAERAIETNEIAAEAEMTLANRYARHLASQNYLRERA